jgi:hypothetical protein
LIAVAENPTAGVSRQFFKGRVDFDHLARPRTEDAAWRRAEVKELPKPLFTFPDGIPKTLVGGDVFGQSDQTDRASGGILDWEDTLPQPAHPTVRATEAVFRI